jgi:rhodanese-related sulfurtransferase
MRLIVAVLALGFVFVGSQFTSQAAAPPAPRPMKAEELKKLIDAGKPVAIVDAREELDGEILKGAVQVTEVQLVNWSETAPKDSPIVFYCTCEHDELSIDAVLGMENLGFTNVYYLEGGLEAARKAGIPIVKPAA